MYHIILVVFSVFYVPYIEVKIQIFTKIQAFLGIIGDSYKWYCSLWNIYGVNSLMILSKVFLKSRYVKIMEVKMFW